MNIAPASEVTSQSRSKVFYGWIVVILAVFSIAVSNGLSIGGIPIFYRSFIGEFGWSRTIIATAGAVPLLTRGLAGPFIGPLWDRYGPRRFMVIGAAVIGLALAGGSFIGVPVHLYLMLLVMAVGLTFAGMGPGTFLATSWFTGQRGIAMGIVATGTSLGGMIFSPISTRLIASYGWRTTMLIYAVFALAVYVPLMHFFVKNHPSEIGAAADPDQSDWFGRRRLLVKSVVTMAAILGTLVYSPISSLLVDRLGQRITILAFALLGLICLGGLARYFAATAGAARASRTARPDPDQGATMSEAMGSLSFWALLLGSSLCYLIIFAVLQQLILHLQSPQIGFSPAAAAWAYSTLFFFSLAGKSLFGFLSDRFSKRVVNLGCCVMMLAGTLILLIINQENTWFFCLLFGLGYGGITVTTRLMLSELFGLRSLGKLLGLTMSVETVFGGGGNLLAGRLFDLTGNYQPAFKVMALCSIVSVMLMALLYRRPPGWSQKPDASLRVSY
ncbi:MAG TPA: MFS transporter [Blastocatellia bacterium]|nr:MFS transporter [Blastocatellia bacterium]